MDTAELEEQLERGKSLHRQGRVDEAASIYRQVLDADQENADALHLLGVIANQQGDHVKAAALIGEALKYKSTAEHFHCNLGLALMGLGALESAHSQFLAELARYPSSHAGHLNLGVLLQRQGNLEQAITHYRAALSLQPDDVMVLNNLGFAHVGLRKFEAAREFAQKSLQIQEKNPDALNVLGLIEQRQGRLSEAIGYFTQALKQRPKSAEIYLNLGASHRDLGQFDRAIEAYRHNLVLAPDQADTYLGLGHVLTVMGRIDEAIGINRMGLRAVANNAEIHSNLLLNLNYKEGVSPEAMLAEARAYGSKAASEATPFNHSGKLSADPERKLRIGLVSGDLGMHPVGFFLQAVLANIDPNKLEMFAYATTSLNDALNKWFRRCIPHWCEADINRLDDMAFASRIHADEIDILIDLAGHTAHNRLPVFAWRPAPVQVAWLGYLCTTGVEAIDYILADAWALPDGEEDQFTETPWRLSESYICFTPPAVAGEVGLLPALSNGHVTFGCFNNLSKVSDRVVACWARVLQAVPESRLFLKSKALGEGEVRKAVADRFARHGVGAERLMMEGQQVSHEEHFRAYQRVDIALDPFPYPGITTTVEGLWMGVPSVALKGDRFLSHQGETILNNAGLPEWIAENEDDYVAKAAAFARDVEQLAALRARLRGQVLASPLFDAPRFARNLEAAFRGMWRKWCAQQSSPGAAD